MFRRTVALGALGLACACIAQPAFDTSSVDPSGSAVGTAPEMVLIPTTTLSGASITPADHAPDHTNGNGRGKGNDKGKGKGKGNCKADDDASSSSSGGSRGSRDDDDCSSPASSDGPPAGGGSSGAPTPGGGAAESPVVRSFWIDAQEVPVRDYGECVALGKCRPAGTGAGCTASAGLADHPITCVSRDQASAFCAWKQKRLVRDVEWTAAAAGASARRYPWGDDDPSSERLNACGAECSHRGMYSGRDGFTGTAPSGSFPLGRSPEGVLDLAGNVAEWVDAPEGVVRGGSYADVDDSAVSAKASRSISVSSAEPTIGFRCARDR